MWPKIIIGFFLCVFAFNAYFTYSAINSQRGFVSDTPYEDGINFDLRKAELTNSANLGWQVELEQVGKSLFLKIENVSSSAETTVIAAFEALNLSRKDKKLKGNFELDQQGRLFIVLQETGQYLFDINVKIGNETGLFSRQVFIH